MAQVRMSREDRKDQIFELLQGEKYGLPLRDICAEIGIGKSTHLWHLMRELVDEGSLQTFSVKEFKQLYATRYFAISDALSSVEICKQGKLPF